MVAPPRSLRGCLPTTTGSGRITGNVSQTIFDFGTLRHRQRAAEAALDQATAQYRSVVLTRFRTSPNSLYALQGDADALAASVKAEGAARKTLDLTRRQLDAGAVNVLALLRRSAGLPADQDLPRPGAGRAPDRHGGAVPGAGRCPDSVLIPSLRCNYGWQADPSCAKPRARRLNRGRAAQHSPLPNRCAIAIPARDSLDGR